MKKEEIQNLINELTITQSNTSAELENLKADNERLRSELRASQISLNRTIMEKDILEDNYNKSDAGKLQRDIEKLTQKMEFLYTIDGVLQITMAHILRLALDGLTVEQIAAKLLCHKSFIYSVLSFDMNNKDSVKKFGNLFFQNKPVFVGKTLEDVANWTNARITALLNGQDDPYAEPVFYG